MAEHTAGMVVAAGYWVVQSSDWQGRRWTAAAWYGTVQDANTAAAQCGALWVAVRQAVELTAAEVERCYQLASDAAIRAGEDWTQLVVEGACPLCGEDAGDDRRGDGVCGPCAAADVVDAAAELG